MKVEIQARLGKNFFRVVKSSKLDKRLWKGLPIYILKLNQPNKTQEGNKSKESDPKWLAKYQDIFPKSLLDAYLCFNSDCRPWRSEHSWRNTLWSCPYSFSFQKHNKRLVSSPTCH